MAEFCLDCWNKLNQTNDSKWRYVISWQKDFCEGCAQYKRVIIKERIWSRVQRMIAEASEYSKEQKKR